MKIKSVITFTEQEYATLNKACMMLDDLINGEYRAAFSEIVNIDLDDFYDAFATLTDYVEEHRE
jgi:hypothetical protein